jgi:hypothetical protein
MSVESRTEDEYPDDSGTVFTVTIPHGSSHLPAALVQDVSLPNANGVSHREME